MTDHITRIAKGLDDYQLLNRQPAVEEPANEFEKSVNALAELQNLRAKIASLTKALDVDEKRLREGVAASLTAYFAANLKEGTNNYELSNGRFVKFGHKVDRKIDESMLTVARADYAAATGVDKPFDDLLRVKYELAAAPYKLLTAAQRHAVSRMMTTKNASPTVVID